jgi:hypothetical protein
MSTSKKAELQKIYNQEIDDYQVADDDDYQMVDETTTSASVSVAPTGVGKVQRRSSLYNANGTMINALDQDNLLGGNTKIKKKQTSKT